MKLCDTDNNGLRSAHLQQPILNSQETALKEPTMAGVVQRLVGQRK